jgi:RNA polymerase sigma factor (sigma-70 family)
MSGTNTLQTSATLLRQVCDLRHAEAWELFVLRYRPLIFHWSRRQGLRHQDAEDVTAEVLAKLASTMPQFQYDPQRRFRSWLKTVAVNAVTDFLRKRSRRAEDGGHAGVEAIGALLDRASGDTDPTAALVSGLEAELHRDVVLVRRASTLVRRRVEANTWKAFEGTAIDGRPGADVAAELGMRVAAVHVAKGRVAKLLRAQFAELRNTMADAAGLDP